MENDFEEKNRLLDGSNVYFTSRRKIFVAVAISAAVMIVVLSVILAIVLTQSNDVDLKNFNVIFMLS